MSTQNLRVAQWLPTTTPVANDGVVVEDDGDGTEFAQINIPGPAGPQGPIGPQGSPGSPGSPGEPGAVGPANELTVGTVTTGAAGTPAQVSIAGTPPAQVVSFVIPQGVQGVPGPVGPAGPPGSSGGVTDHGALTGLSDDDHPQYMLKDENSGPSIVTGGIVTSNPDGTVNVSAGSGFLRSANDPNAPVVDVTWPAVTNQAIAENVPTYVYIDYNGGTPSVLLSTVYSNTYLRSLVAGVSRSGTSVFITQGSVPAGNVSRQVSRYLFTARGIDRVSGLITAETGTRNLTNTAGTVFSGLNEFVLGAKNTATGDTFTTYYRNGSGGWTSVAAQTQWNNTQYDNGSGTLATLASGRHGVHWIFRDVDGGFHLLYGQDTYTLAQAQAAGLPATRPPNLQYWHASFCAKLIFQRSDATARQIDIPFYSNIGAGSASDHGALAGLSDDDHPQYLTQARGDALYAPIGGGGLTDGDKGDITVSGSGATWTIDPQSVTYAKVQNVATARLLGRASSGAGVLEEITLGSNLSFSGTTLNAAGGGGGTPGGASTNIQYNSGGVFAGSADLTWDNSTRTLTVGGTSNGVIKAPSNSSSPTLGVQGGTSGAGAGGSCNVSGGAATSNGQAGGNALLQGGAGLTTGTGGNANVQGGTSPSGTAGNVNLIGGNTTSGTYGYIACLTSGTERLRILPNGAWSVGTAGTATGTSGHVLTSQGSGSPPIWAAPSGGGGTPGGSNTQIQFNNSSAFGGDADFTWDSSGNRLTVGSLATPGTIRGSDSTTGAGSALTIRGGNTTNAGSAGGILALTGGAPGANGAPGSINMTIVGAGAAAGGSINLTAGTADTNPGAVKLAGGLCAAATGTGGAITITGGNVGGSATGGPVTIMGGGYAPEYGLQSGSTGGTVTIAGGDMLALGNGTPGNVVIRGGRVTGGYTGASGHVTVQGGDGLTANAGGNVTIRGGTSASGTAGYVNFQTGATTERFRILANGAWSVGAAGTDTGTAGQVLTSNGNAGPPTWQTPASDARLKDDIADLDLGLAFVRQLRPVSFAWKHDETKMPHFGLIAQDVLKVLAGRECGLVDTSGERYGMTYTELIPILIRAIQQLAKLIPQQEAA